MPRYGYGHGFAFPDYVSVAEKKARARAFAEKLARKRGRVLEPVAALQGRGNKLASTFWGKAWCDNLESYGDYANRLPRGRSYTRHGAVIDLRIGSGKITAVVSGSAAYDVGVVIRSLHARRWGEIAAACAGKIDSLVDLLHGRLSQQVMEIVTAKESGLFPAPDQISFDCSCPDSADMCKHVAASLYGVGLRLDEKPELLFTLRGVDHGELVAAAAAAPRLGTGRATPASAPRKVIKGADLSALFGIEVEAPEAADATPKVKPKPTKAKPTKPKATEMKATKPRVTSRTAGRQRK